MQLKTKYLNLLADNGINPAALYNVCNTATIERGIDYWEDGKVSSFHAEKSADGNVSIQAKVQGSSGHTYLTRVNFNAHSPRWITGVCTCPVSSNCKHAIATLFEYLEYAKRQQVRESKLKVPAFTAATLPTARVARVSPIDLWLQGLAQTEKPRLLTDNNSALADLEERQPQLLYLLSQGHHYNPDVISLGLYKSSLLKKGGFGKPSPVVLESLLNPYRTRSYAYEPHDLMIAQLLAVPTMRFTHYNHQDALTGEGGEQVLEEILKTERTFWATPDNWQRDAHPLLAGEPRTFQFGWQQDGNGQYSVHLRPDLPVNVHFWLNGKLWYVDLQRYTCGLLQHSDLTATQVEKFLSAPPIPPEQADTVSERLLELLPDADIPTPSVRIQQHIEDLHLPLQPDLLLQSLPIPDHTSRMPVASLRFNYGGHILQPDTLSARSLAKADGKRYRIHRKTTAEQDAYATLLDYGFSNEGNAQHGLHRLELRMNSPSAMLNAVRWHDFLEHGVTELREAGWHISSAGNFDLQFETVDDLEADWQESSSGIDWFEVSLGFELAGQRINLLPILIDMLAQMESPQALQALLLRQEYVLVPLANNRWVKLDASRLHAIMETLVELYDQQPLNANGNLEFSRYQSAGLGALLNAPGLKWKGADEIIALTKKLSDFSGIQDVPLPVGLNASLRPYQQTGLNWLQFLREYRFNGVLADDMGLGKTLQALAHLLIEKQAGRLQQPALVIAPTSLMGNWRREAQRFAPELRVLLVHGHDRQKHFDAFAEYDLILTTYPLILRDEDQYLRYTFHYLILDEAQAIKNAASRTTQIIYSLKANNRLCLTGTPMENHLGELWSMFHFLMPGFLGTHERFARLFRTPIEKQGDGGRQQQLRQRIQPFMLRRTKEVVASELPPKTEIVRSMALEGKQRDLYEIVRLAMDAKVQEEISKKGFARSHIMILDALLKLRQVCCDPRLVKLDKARNVQESAKLELLMTLLPEMVEEGRKVLLFSQFTSMLALIEEELQTAGIVYSKLTGQTKNRDEVIAHFQEGNAQVFLISLKAGGTGLNLTAADTVIHYDPWWNPAVEQQATDRAYRIGQDKPVFVYKLITEDTVEEKILKLQEKKQALADSLYSEQAEQDGPRFSTDDLMDLLKPLE